MTCGLRPVKAHHRGQGNAVTATVHNEEPFDFRGKTLLWVIGGSLDVGPDEINALAALENCVLFGR